jgi:hypothetical protein
MPASLASGTSASTQSSARVGEDHQGLAVGADEFAQRDFALHDLPIDRRLDRVTRRDLARAREVSTSSCFIPRRCRRFSEAIAAASAALTPAIALVLGLAALHLGERDALRLLVQPLGPLPRDLAEIDGRPSGQHRSLLLEVVRLGLAEFGAFDDHQFLSGLDHVAQSNLHSRPRGPAAASRRAPWPRC